MDPSPSIKEYVRFFKTPGERLGSTYVPDQGTYFRFWAPDADHVSLCLKSGKTCPMEKNDGYFTCMMDAPPGTEYRYRMHNLYEVTDPATRFLPEGIGGPGQVVSRDFDWTDQDWKGVPHDETVFYELHTGTYSPKNNFDGIIEDLPRLKDLGITTIELMPVCQFPGDRNWGYDGAFFHAVQNSYGRPEDLKRLVNACHSHGLAIILDVVYNHAGPEGSVLPLCAPYHVEKYQSAWGSGLNFDDEHSHDVRRFFLQAVWDWLVEFHFDGLRLDAIHMIHDASPLKFLQEMTLLAKEAEKIRGLPLLMVAESDKNDPTLLWPVDRNGMGMDAHWADDFHHCLHATLTGHKDGYYADYGGLEQMAQIYERGVAFEGHISAFRKRHHGRSYEGVDKKSLVVEIQNHDQIGNSPSGERLIALTDFPTAKFAAACLFLSPFTPLIFMGEEIACRQPFYYFTNYYDPTLTQAVEDGRKEEWKTFGSLEQMKNAGDLDTFLQSVLKDKNPDQSAESAQMFDYYKRLVELSKKVRRFSDYKVIKGDQSIDLVYSGDGKEMTVSLNFKEKSVTIDNLPLV